MLGQVIAIGREEPTHALAVGDQAFQDYARNSVQVVKVNDRFRKLDGGCCRFGRKYQPKTRPRRT